MANSVSSSPSLPAPLKTQEIPDWLSSAYIAPEEIKVPLSEKEFLLYNPETQIARLFQKKEGSRFIEWAANEEISHKELLSIPRNRYRLWLDREGSMTLIYNETYASQSEISFCRMFSEEDFGKGLSLWSATPPSVYKICAQDIKSYLKLSPDPHRYEKVRLLLSSFSQKEIQILFDRIAENSIWVFKALWPLVDLSKEENGKKMVELAVRWGLIDPLDAVLKKWPNLLENSWTDKDFFREAIGNKHFPMARYLIEHGWGSNRQTKIFNEMFAMIVYSPLSTVLNYLSETLDSDKQDRIHLEELLSFLLTQGADPNIPIYLQSTGIPQFPAEFCLSYEGESGPYLRKLAIPLIKKGALITDPMAMRMKKMVRDYPGFGECLLRQEKITPEELLLLTKKDIAVGSIEDCLKQIFETCDQLQEMLKGSRSNWNLLDFPKLERIKQFKAHIKLRMKEHESIRVQLESSYEKLHHLYDQIVKLHPLLREMQGASREFRIMTRSKKAGRLLPPSSRLSKFYSLWNFGKVYEQTRVDMALQSIPEEERPVVWHEIRQQIMEAASFIQGELSLLQGSPSFRIHGTKLTPPILHSKRLLAKGIQNTEGIVPFSGELRGTDRPEGLNAANLSFSSLSSDWEDTAVYFDVTTRGLLSIMYAEQTMGNGYTEKYFNPKKPESSIERTKWENIQRALATNDQRMITACCIDIGWLRSVGNTYDEILKPAQEQIANLLTTVDPTSAQYPLLKQLHEAFIAPIKYPLSEQDCELLSEKISIVFATANHDGEPCFTRDGELAEFLLPGRLDFGKDIEIAFVPAQHLDRARSLLNKLGVKVYDLNILKYLEAERMARGAQDALFEAGIQTFSPIQKEQARINYYLKRDILPNYSIPFPENPTYFDENGELRRVEEPLYGAHHPSYATYIQGVREGSGLPRPTHGRMHATGTAILSLALRNKIGAKELDAVLTAFAAADHDSQREDDGTDRYELQSAAHLRRYLLQRGYSEQAADFYSAAIAHENSENYPFASKIQEIVNTADTLEILRCLPKKEDFDKTRAAILLDDAFIDEWAGFIALTDTVALQLALEHHSENYFADVMRILSLVKEKYPIISSHLQQELACHDPKDLPAEVLEVLEGVYTARR